MTTRTSVIFLSSLSAVPYSMNDSMAYFQLSNSMCTKQTVLVPYCIQKMIIYLSVLVCVCQVLFPALTHYEETRAAIPGGRSNYPIPKALQHIEPGTVVIIFKGLMGKKILALWLRS